VNPLAVAAAMHLLTAKAAEEEAEAKQAEAVRAEAKHRARNPEPAPAPLNRADRRRLAKAMRKVDVWPPRQLSMVNGSIYFNPALAKAIAIVTVNGEVIEQCIEYDMDKGFATPKGGARRHGIVKVTLK
jgi:hypothetical protein